MATPVENSLFIALHTLIVMLDAKGLISRAEYVEALKLDTSGRPKDIAAVLTDIARQYAPKSTPALKIIEGGRSGGRDGVSR